MKSTTKKFLLGMFLLCTAAAGIWASTGPAQTPSITHQMTQLVIQVAVILAATWIGGKLARLLRLPPVIGQILAGAVIGPFALGGLPLPSFPEGLFPALGGPIPVSTIIYALSTLAAIILLFMSGLETDLVLFLRYMAKGGVVGVGGVLVSFLTGAWLMSRHAGISIGDPVPLFMGALSVATSVGITATILSQKRKIDSPEGTVILSAAVIDDILGIIILAVVLGVVSMGGNATQGPLDILWIAVRAIGIWGIATFVGVKFARPIGKALKQTFRDRSVLAIMALGLALLLSGVFELAGLSMIIGAYIMGLTLSNTDLAFVIQGRLRTLHDLFVPIFFAVSGMMVDFGTLASWETLGFGLLFTAVAIIAKLVGSGLPALALNFSWTGAMRIGWGMVPRGEVALIIAGIGVSSGLLSESVFGIAMIMTLGTTILAPPVLSALLKSPKKGLRKSGSQTERMETIVDLQTPEFAELLLSHFLAGMEKEGFFVNRLDHEEEFYQIRKDNVFISLSVNSEGRARFVSDPENVGLFQTALYESLLKVSESAGSLRERLRPEEMAQRASTAASHAKAAFDLSPYLDVKRVSLGVDERSKNRLIETLVGLCETKDRELVVADVMERERSMSTGLQHGIAIPHAKTNGTQRMQVAIAVLNQGLDYGSLDGEQVRIVALILSPKKGYGPHLQLLAGLASALNKEATRKAILAAQTPYEVLRVLGVGNGQIQK